MTLDNPEAGIEIWLPDTWKQQIEGEDLTIESPDGEMSMVMTLLESNDVEAALKERKQKITEAIGEFTLEEPTELEINGMKMIDFGGEAMGGKIKLSISLLQTPTNRVLTIFAFATEAAVKKHEADLIKIVQGLKPRANKAPASSFAAKAAAAFKQPAPPQSPPPAPGEQAEAKIRAMQPLFESVINCINSIEGGWNGRYSAANPQFMWSILYFFATSHAQLNSQVEQSDDAFLVPRGVMQDFASACFADYINLLPIPAGDEFISYDDSWDRYTVKMSDAGAAVFNIGAINLEANGKYSVTVVMLDEEEAEVYGNYMFTLVPNAYSTKYTETLFSFSIENVESIEGCTD